MILLLHHLKRLLLFHLLIHHVLRSISVQVLTFRSRLQPPLFLNQVVLTLNLEIAEPLLLNLRHLLLEEIHLPQQLLNSRGLVFLVGLLNLHQMLPVLERLLHRNFDLLVRTLLDGCDLSLVTFDLFLADLLQSLHLGLIVCEHLLKVLLVRNE